MSLAMPCRAIVVTSHPLCAGASSARPSHGAYYAIALSGRGPSPDPRRARAGRGSRLLRERRALHLIQRSTSDARRRRAAEGPQYCVAVVAGDPADAGPAARVAVQHPDPRLRQSDARCPRARPVRRHRRARHRGGVARRELRAVRRQRRRGARAAAQQCRGAGPRRRHQGVSPRRHQSRPGASDGAVLRWRSRSALSA